MTDHPLSVYLSDLRSNAKDGEYRQELNRLTSALDISLPTLYRLQLPPGKARRTLNPVKAMTMELVTDGKVPAGSVNDDIDQIIDVVPKLKKHRLLMNATAA